MFYNVQSFSFFLMSDLKDKKAVLWYPKNDVDSYWSFKTTMDLYFPKTKFGTTPVLMPPIGLMGLFNYLKDYYADIVLIDRNVDPRPMSVLLKDADHVYLSGMIAQSNNAFNDSVMIKSLGKVLISGGPLVDKDSKVAQISDFAVENEAEKVMDVLLEDLSKEKLKKFYKGVAASPEEFFIPDFSSVNLDNYFNVGVQWSRGCPKLCEFCDIVSRFGNVPRLTPIKHIEKVLKQLFSLDQRKAMFVVDDNFIGNPKKTIETLDKIYNIESEIGYRRPKFTELSVDLANDTYKYNELAFKLRKNNFFSFFIGIETDNVDALKETKKFQNFKNGTVNEKLIDINKKTGASIMSGMIRGFDADKKGTIDDAINFVNKTTSPMTMYGLLIALPHTQLESRLKLQGRLKKSSSGNNTEGTMNFIPMNFSVKEAEKDYVKLLNGIYEDNNYFNRVLNELELIEPAENSSTLGLIERLSVVSKILTKENSISIWKGLFKADKIIRKRHSFGSEKYVGLITEYFTHAARFAHFKRETKEITNLFSKKFDLDSYESWQKYSLNDITSSNVKEVDFLKGQNSLYDEIKFKLFNGFEFVGSRIDGLTQMIEPFLKESFLGLDKSVCDSVEALSKIHKKAYLNVAKKHNKLMSNINLEELNSYIDALKYSDSDYRKNLINLHRFYNSTV